MAAPSDSSLYGSRDFDELVAILSPNNNVNNGSNSANNSLRNSANNSLHNSATNSLHNSNNNSLPNSIPVVGSDVEARIASSASGRSSRSNRSLQRQFQQQLQQQRGEGWALESVESLVESGDPMTLPLPPATTTDDAVSVS